MTTGRIIKGYGLFIIGLFIASMGVAFSTKAGLGTSPVASAYILLAAEQYDIGACWVQIRNRMGKSQTSDIEIRNLLGIPEGYEVLNLIALGEKGEIKKGYDESEFDHRKIHQESFKK